MEKIENKNLLSLISSGQEIYKQTKYVKKPPMKNGLSSVRPKKIMQFCF
jgi:hypothetical protein